MPKQHIQPELEKTPGWAAADLAVQAQVPKRELWLQRQGRAGVAPPRLTQAVQVL